MAASYCLIRSAGYGVRDCACDSSNDMLLVPIGNELCRTQEDSMFTYLRVNHMLLNSDSQVIYLALGACDISGNSSWDDSFLDSYGD